MAITARLEILSKAEIEELYGMPVLSEQDQRFFFSLNDSEHEAVAKSRTRRGQCMYVLLLGYFKSKPVVLKPRFYEVKDDLAFIAQQILPGKGFTPFNLEQYELERVYERVFRSLGYRRWSERNDSTELKSFLIREASNWSYPRYLFDRAIEHLSTKKIAIPAYTTIQKIISEVINKHQDNLQKTLSDGLSSALTSWLSELISPSNNGLKMLRSEASSQTGKELEKELEAHRLLLPHTDEIKRVVDALEMSPSNQQHYAERVTYYGAKLKRRAPKDQRLYLLCYLVQRWEQALERIADGFIYQVEQAKQKAQSYGKEQVYKDWQQAKDNVSKAAKVLSLFVDEDINPDSPFREVKAQANELLTADELRSVARFMDNQKLTAEEGQWLYLDQQSPLRTGLLRRLFNCLKFEGTEQVNCLVDMLDQLRRAHTQSKPLQPALEELNFITKSSRKWLLDESEQINSSRLEWYLYLQIPTRIRGQLSLPEITKYRPLEADLHDHESWVNEKEQLLDEVQQEALSACPEALIESKVAELTAKLLTTSESLADTDNRNVVLRQKGGKRHWRLPTTNKKLLLENPFFKQLPTTALSDALRIVDRETQFIDHFEHVLGKANPSRLQETDLLAILIANATNQGIYGMAQISDRSYEEMRTIQSNYLRPETLQQANDLINNATAKLPIFKYYNIQDDLVHASADGQKYESKRETFKTRYSSKYFGTQKGVSAISLIANHANINARVIGANEHESHFIFDLLMNNSSEIIPKVLSTDTHGVNHVNFALLDLFGYRFAPRYAQFSTVINEMFDVSEDDNSKVRLKLKKPINTKVIKAHWDTIQRIAVSLHKRKTDQATLVRKLSGYKSNHPLLEALSEYNRLVKAQYLLDYIDDASLRNHVQRALNRGEAYHQLRRALSNVNGDRFRGNSDEEIHLWNECARLVSNAVIYYNSWLLSGLLEHFEQKGKEDLLEMVKKASPVAWFNLNFKGTYLFGNNKSLPTLEDLMENIVEYKAA